MDQQEAIRNARQLGLPKMLVLGLQHMFAMFGATILVPILVQSYGLPLNIQTTLFFAGVGTLFFHLCARLKVPAFLGSSFAFLGGFETMAKMAAALWWPGFFIWRWLLSSRWWGSKRSCGFCPRWSPGPSLSVSG